MPYFNATRLFNPQPSNTCDLQPAKEWGRSLSPILEIVKFVTYKDVYPPPTDVDLFFESGCLGQFMCMFDFVNVCACSISLEQSRLSVSMYTPPLYKDGS